MNARRGDRSLASIRYQIRRVQIIDALILAGIVGTFSLSFSTNQKVTEMKAEAVAEERLNSADPMVRDSRHRADISVVRAEAQMLQHRITELEQKKE